MVLMPQVQVTLTPSESKRLIAKGVARLPEVRRALKRGTVLVCLGTTNGYVAEELGIRVDKNRFAAGVVLPKGTCSLSMNTGTKEIVLRKGKQTEERLADVVDELGPEDVIIKGANALDSSWTAGVFLASEDGGTVGRFFGAAVSRGVSLVIPVGLEKFIPGSIWEVSRRTGTRKFSHATGLPVGLSLLRGRVVTEIEAIKLLTGARAEAMGAGGVSGAEGSVTLLVSGSDQQAKALKRLLGEIKGERPLNVKTECKTCGFKGCFRPE